MTCTRIGGIAICEVCLADYVDGWVDALGEFWTVREQQEDLIACVAEAETVIERAVVSRMWGSEDTA